MHLPAGWEPFGKRAPGDSPPNNDNRVQPVVITTLATIGTIILLIVLYYIALCTRLRHPNPTYIPTPFLKRRWQCWRGGSGSKASSSYHRTSEHLEPISEAGSTRTRATRVRSNNPRAAVSRTRSSDIALETGAGGTATSPTAAQAAEARGIDRNTSVRSIMTLPAYRPHPLAHETVLGREGDRSGIDIVLEHPESVSELEELRREEEMEALYQVRLARRREVQEREEWRRLRREARERGDWRGVEEVRVRERSRSGAGAGAGAGAEDGREERGLQELREEHARLRDRPRAVSSVSYADVGIALHDGSRIRTTSIPRSMDRNSGESERVGLLGDAASIAASGSGGGGGGGGGGFHRRDRSASSVLSMDSETGLPSPPSIRDLTMARERGNSLGEGSGSLLSRPPTSSGADGPMSSPDLVDEADLGLGDGEFPEHVGEPPGYEHVALGDGGDYGGEEPPGYYSGAPPRLPSLRLGSVPSIVVEGASPVVPTPRQ